MTDITAPQAGFVAPLRITAEGIGSPQAGFVAPINFPAEFLNIPQAGVTSPLRQASPVSATQMGMVIPARGQFDNPRIRAWAYSQDSHDFYVLRLGMEATLIYDTTTQQWSEWDGSGYPFWRAALGLNWIGMSKDNFDGDPGAATQIVVGDDSLGILWTLDPEQGYDEAIDATSGDIPVIRAVRGGIPFRGRHRSRTNGVWLTISNGRPTLPLAAVILRTSDDQGVTWQDRGTITVIPSDYSQNLYWRSLGLMRAPGRLFEFEDDGAMIRIDSADVDMSKDDQGGPSA